MAENFCELFEDCDALDGRLLINRTLQGTPLATDEGELPFGALSVRGGVLRPYLDLTFEQRWIAKEACYGPVRSVMGLAPGESVTIEVSHREQIEHTSLVETALNDTVNRTQSRSEHRSGPDSGTGSLLSNLAQAVHQQGLKLGEPLGSAMASMIGNALDSAANQARQAEQKIERVGEAALKLPDVIVGLFGSIFEDIGNVVVGVATGGASFVADQAVEQIGNLVGNVVGGGGAGGGGAGAMFPPIVQRTLREVDTALQTVQIRERQHTVSDRTTRSSSFEQRIRRTFANPYRDRSLELRFIPVFRRFEVVTRPHFGRLGLLANVGRVVMPKQGAGLKYGELLRKVVPDANVHALIADEFKPGGKRSLPRSAIAEHVDANAGVYTRRFLQAAHNDGDLDSLQAPMARLLGKVRQRAGQPTPLHALAWSSAEVAGANVKVPLGEPENIGKAWQLSSGAVTKLRDALDRIHPDRMPSLFPQAKSRDVHLFMGTHVEAVAGRCVLKDLPPPA